MQQLHPRGARGYSVHPQVGCSVTCGSATWNCPCQLWFLPCPGFSHLHAHLHGQSSAPAQPLEPALAAPDEEGVGHDGAGVDCALAPCVSKTQGLGRSWDPDSGLCSEKSQLQPALRETSCVEPLLSSPQLREVGASRNVHPRYPLASKARYPARDWSAPGRAVGTPWPEGGWDPS